MDIVEFEPVGQRIAVLAAAIFSVSLYKWLEQFQITEGAYKGQAIFHPVIALVIVLPLAAVVHSWTDYVLCKLPMRLRFSRRLLSPTASIEGYWFQYVYDGANPYSVICIEFDPPTNAYKYHGNNYKCDFNLNAHFDSVQTSIHASGSELTFNFVAGVHRWDPAKNTVDTDAARGYGRITFTTETSKDFVLGKGEFFETNPKPNWRTFQLYKIPDATIVKALENRIHAVDDMDYSALLKHTLLDRQEKQLGLDRALSERSASLGLSAQESLNISPQGQVTGDSVQLAGSSDGETVSVEPR